MVRLCTAISVQLCSWDVRCSFLDVVGAFSRNMEELDVAFAEMRSPGGLKTANRGSMSCQNGLLLFPAMRFVRRPNTRNSHNFSLCFMIKTDSWSGGKENSIRRIQVPCRQINQSG